jgi:hypothetical protein
VDDLGRRLTANRHRHGHDRSQHQVRGTRERAHRTGRAAGRGSRWSFDGFEGRRPSVTRVGPR